MWCALGARQCSTPDQSETPVATVYCGVDSADVAPIRAGDLGRCETATVSGFGTAGSAHYALTWRERIGVAPAAERVSVLGLD